MATRRDLIAGCAAATVTSLAGCSALPFVGGGGGDAGSYEDWLPARQGGFLRFGSQRVSALADRSGVPDRLVDNRVFGVDAAEIDRYAFVEHDRTRADVVVSSLSADALTDRLLESDRIARMQSVDAYGGYERFSLEASDRHVALRDGTVIVGPPSLLEAAVDAERGAGDRVVAASEAADLLTGVLEDDDRVQGERPARARRRRGTAPGAVRG